MANDREQVKVERTRRSRRNHDAEQIPAQTAGRAYEESQVQLEEIDNIISDIVGPSPSEQSVVLGDDQAHGVRTISSEAFSNLG
jgi:hypothetical protein